MVSWTAASILATLVPAAKAARVAGDVTLEGILKSRSPAVTLSTILEKKTSSAVPNRLVDKVIAYLLLAGIVDHGLAVGEATAGTESEIGGDSTEAIPDHAPHADSTRSLDMSIMDDALAAAVQSSGVVAEVGRKGSASVDAGGTGVVTRNSGAPFSRNDVPTQLTQLEKEAAERKRKREKLVAELLAAEEEEAAFLASEARRRQTPPIRGRLDGVLSTSAGGAAGSREPIVIRTRQQALADGVTF